MAPGVTFWDAGEFIAAAHVFGIPHPPGTPLFVAFGRAWTLALGGILGVARASNLVSALSTAVAGALTAWVVAREAPRARDMAWGALAGVLCAGLMTSAWANATETEVYAVSLLHVTVLLACASRAAEGEDDAGNRWVLCMVYLIALAPAVHLSALVGVPAAIALAARRGDGRWSVTRVLLLGGVLVVSAGIGRMSPMIVAIGAAITLSSIVVAPHADERRARVVGHALAALALSAIAASALLIMLVRARHDPFLNQGNPSTFGALVEVVGRHQYEVAPLWPRQAPAWLQLATLAQYADWQFAFAWGDGIFTTPVRVLVTALFVALGAMGWRSMRAHARRSADAVGLLTLCGSLGVCAYLNLKAGSSLGYGFVPADAHEARERDYFFVLAFWGWGILAGQGALALARRRGWPSWVALAAAAVPLLGNWRANDRARGDQATAPHVVAAALLTSAPPSAVMFVGGDNDTYPLWYAQQVEGLRPDVSLVTMPLLPADWYNAEVARRTGLRWPAREYVPGAKWSHEERAALIARSARAAGRPVVASPALSAHDRSLLGAEWTMRGVVYVSGAPADGSSLPPTFPTLPTSSAAGRAFGTGRVRRVELPDDVSAMMLGLLECPRLGAPVSVRSPGRDSLEVRCNLR
jgi:hypothetical protein